jgi:mannose-6-phosphate isomerase
MESTLSGPVFLRNKIQNYDWGTRNEDAYIPRLLDMEPVKDLPYAELWMGIHPNAPSEALFNDVYLGLDELIRQFPEKILGVSNSRTFQNKLPFLFKVLSAGEALSIQAHPSKSQAAWLHSQDAAHYPDINHKPEIAIALNELTALVGFKAYPELQSIFHRYPELKEFSASEVINNFCQSRFTDSLRRIQVWKSVFSSLMMRAANETERLESALRNLEQRLLKTDSDLRSEHEKLFLQLRPKYGADIGLFTLFFLEIAHLKSGDALFIDAGVPHAYLHGNIIECMANSDNVVRAGLTPKFKDLEALTEILDYNHHEMTRIGSHSNYGEMEYRAPAEEFLVKRWQIAHGETRLIRMHNAVQVLILMNGLAEIETMAGKWLIRKGQSALLPACLVQYSITADTETDIFAATIPQ